MFRIRSVATEKEILPESKHRSVRAIRAYIILASFAFGIAFHRNGCTARRNGSFGGRRVFEFPCRKQPARYRATGQLSENSQLDTEHRSSYLRPDRNVTFRPTVPRLLGRKRNWGGINADCKFAALPKVYVNIWTKTERLDWAVAIATAGAHGPMS